MPKLIELFTKNLTTRQRQYEAIRAFAFGEGDIEEIASHFGYSPQSLRNLLNLVRKGEHELFPSVKPGPKGRRTPKEVAEYITGLRRKNHLSSYQIAEELKKEGISMGVRTVERVLSDAGFPKLRRRTMEERGFAKKGTLLPERSSMLDFDKLEPFRQDCQVAGVFFFLPYIIESGILDVVTQCALPSSSDIDSRQAALSMLLLKLIGRERLSHIRQYDLDRGFGVFAGLNVLPKPTYMCTYSCRTEASMLMEFQREMIAKLQGLYPDVYQCRTINLDFHSIPHFGDESSMERVWCGSRGKSMKGANTFFAQSGETDALLYTKADIKRSASSEEIKNFVDYWLNLKGVVDQTLVFDSKLTRYDILYELDGQGVKFITLRKRTRKLAEEALNIPDDRWQKIYLPIPKRKYKHVKVHESRVALLAGAEEFRQLIIKDHGRSEPTFVITNNHKMKIQEVLTVYAKRWHIENKLSELVNFFSLNALSSPIMTRIHFDILWTVIADTLYHLFAKDLSMFEKAGAAQIFSRFIDMPGQVHYDGEGFNIRIRKRAATPLLMGMKKLKSDINVPWLENKPVRIIWTP
jgi:transposase